MRDKGRNTLTMSLQHPLFYYLILIGFRYIRHRAYMYVLHASYSIQVLYRFSWRCRIRKKLLVFSSNYESCFCLISRVVQKLLNRTKSIEII